MAGDFLFDTGSEQAVIVDSVWAKRQGFAEGLTVIGTKLLHDPRGATYETRTVLAPLFRFDGARLTTVPTMILGSKNPVGFGINYLGNDLLKRFNLILDFRKDAVYAKPNQLFHLKFRGEI